MLFTKKNLLAIIIVLMATVNLSADWTWGPLENVGNVASVCQVVFEDNAGNVVVSYANATMQSQVGYYQVKDSGATTFDSKVQLGSRVYPKKYLNVNGEDRLFFLQEKINNNGEFEVYYKTWNAVNQTFGERILFVDASKITSLANIDVIQFGGSTYVVWDNEYQTNYDTESRIAISIDGVSQFLTNVGEYAINPQFFVKNNELYLSYQNDNILIIRKITSTVGPEINTGKSVMNFGISNDGRNMLCVDDDLMLEAYTVNNNLTFQYLYNIGDGCDFYRFFSCNNQNYIVYQLNDDCAIGLLSNSFELKKTIVNGYMTDRLDIFATATDIHVTFLSYELAVPGGTTTTVKYTKGVSTSAILQPLSVPSEIVLIQNYPNPFNNSTSICFDLPKSGQVNLVVYNAKGELVKTLVNSVLPSGKQSVTFEANSMNSGVYYYKLTTAGKTIVNKMLLVK